MLRANKIQIFLSTACAIAIVAVIVFGLSGSVSAYSIQEGVNAARGNGQPTELFGSAGVITTLSNTLLFIAGALSVIMIVVGGLRYVVSGGNSTAVTAAKNTILYAIVGLIIAMLAFAAINFVLSTVMPGSSVGYTNV